jgi:glycosyltransferase 2 family protein
MMELVRGARDNAELQPPSTWVRQVISIGLRVAISGGLLWLVTHRLSAADVSDRLAKADLYYLGLALIVLMALTVFAALRWRLVCQAAQCVIGRLEAWRISMIANSLDQLLFTLSGDTFRIWWLSRRGPSITHAFCGTILDRVLGVVALTLLIGAVLPFLFALDSIGNLIWAPALAALAGFCGLVTLLAFSSLPLPAFPLRGSLDLLSLTARRLMLDPGRAVPALGLALVVHLGAVLAMAAIGAGIGAKISLGWYLLVTPTVMMLTMLPISVGGWGVREGAMVVGLGLAGLPMIDALLVSVLFGICSTAVALAGAMLWLFGLPETDKEALWQGK